MRRRRTDSRLGHWPLALGGLAWLVMPASPAGAQDATRIPTAPSPSVLAVPQARPPAAVTMGTHATAAVDYALRIDPITAPYPISAELIGRRLILSGRVGSKTVHDQAVRIAIVANVPIDDRLVIDTSLARYAMPPNPFSPGAATNVAPSGFASATLPYSAAYGYPPPLVSGPGYTSPFFDPFYGFNPPDASFPPWWGALTSRRAPERFGPPPAGPAPGTAAAPPAGDLSPSGQPGQVELIVDDQTGVGTLRGEVATESDRRAVVDRVSRDPTLRQVVDQITVREPAPQPARPENTPPPPPEPYVAPPAPAAAPAPAPAAAPVVPAPERSPAPAPAPIEPARACVDAQLGQRLARSMARQPGGADAGVRATARDGVVTLAGRVPSIYEAMLAYRAAEQTPGVRQVVDRLEFSVPDGQVRNPLLDKGRPEDVEPYLAAQIRRQVGDNAHVDRVRLHGDELEVRGSLDRGDDRPRVEAILRSMPALRGFRLDAEFTADGP